MPQSGVDHIEWLANEYYGNALSFQKPTTQRHSELNGSHIEILETPPTALEFSRLVRVSRPVIIKGLKIPAMEKWSDDYLINEMGERRISIAVTPNGRADAVTKGPDGSLYFAEPCVDKMTISELLSRLSSDQSEICYLQSQNGNLYTSEYFEGQGKDIPTEFEPLRKDVPCQIPWCSEALDRSPDAVNLWIGNGKSVTSVHSDPYENLYTVVRGAKYFTLLPPTEGRYLNERRYPHAQYSRSPDGILQLIPSTNNPPVRWSSIPDPHLHGTLPAEAHPLHVSLLPGDTLYLPAGWWHHVRQSAEMTIAVNWWYDTEMRGMSWVILSFMRRFGSAAVDLEDDDQASTSCVTVTS